MNYYVDTEFHEYKKKHFPFSKGISTIDLISIGIVSEDGREYSAVSNEFNLKDAWNNEWLRENVLTTLYDKLKRNLSAYDKTYHWELFQPFTRRSLKNLIRWFGKPKKQIQRELTQFIKDPNDEAYDKWVGSLDSFYRALYDLDVGDIHFYGYYSDYDWVVTCDLFSGNGIHDKKSSAMSYTLPKGFDFYCKDLKQIADEKYIRYKNEFEEREMRGVKQDSFINCLEEHPNYPQQIDNHSEIDDAKWNMDFHKFLNRLMK